MINTPGSLVDRTLRRKRELLQSKQALNSAFINFSFIIALIIDMKLDFISNIFKISSHWVWYIELPLIIVCGINILFNLLIYVRLTILYIPIPLTTRQKKLLSIDDSDVGFVSPKVSTPFPPNLDTLSPNFMTTSFLNSSSLNTTGDISWSPRSNLSQTLSSSWTYYPQNISYQGSPSQQQDVSRIQLRSPNQSLDTLNDSSFRLRKITSTPSKDNIEDEASLVKYLKQFEQRNQSDEFASHSPPNVSSFWNVGHTLLDYSSLLRKYTYQLASRSAQPFTSHPDGDSNLTTHSPTEDVWFRYGVGSEYLYIWTKNLRQWLALTILERVVHEIDVINDTLYRMGSSDLHIGEVSLSTLRQVFKTKSQIIPTLTVLLPYLEMTPNQEYLVQRIRELSRGGCMSDFVWNGGGQFKGKPWADHLPTDAAIVMHLFCTYFDSRLPPHPNHPDGKTFTNQRFIRTPDKPVLNKDSLCIYQTRISPPHFKLVVGEEILDLAKGRNNMFHVLLLFLFHIKTKENGMLGRVNLGLSGVNILWVLDNN